MNETAPTTTSPAATPVAPPAALPLVGVSLASLAATHGLTLVGPDRPVRFLGRIKADREVMSDVLTFVTAATWLDAFVQSGHEAAIVERRLVPAGGLHPERSWLVADEPADTVFFRAHLALVAAGQAPLLATSIDPSARIHPRAFVADNVQIGPGCRIDAGAIVHANTVLGSNVVVASGAVLGSEGFETKVLDGKRQLVPHTGGVRIDDDCSIGANTVIDRGLFGTFTHVRRGTQIDNLCHIAHNVQIGEECGIVAQALVAGSVRVGNGVWWGPAAVSNHEVVVGDCAYIGSGAVVVRDLPAHALAFGSPAKVRGWACRCRNKVEVVDGRAVCSKCGTTMEPDGDGLRIVASTGAASTSG